MPVPGPRRPRIAVLDDSDELAELLRELLEDIEGYGVDVHTSWTDGAGFVKERQPDLVLLDVLFDSEQQGWLVLLQIKEDPATQHIPLIVCSGDRASLQDYQALLKEYGVPAIEKPFDVDELLDLIKQALSDQTPAGG